MLKPVVPTVAERGRTTSERAADPVVVRVVRELPVDLPAAYAWLTDYQSSDGPIFGKGVTRTALRLDPAHIRVRTTFRSAFVRSDIDGITALFPPDHWRYCGEIQGRNGKVAEVFNDYRLAPIGAARSQLTTEIHLDVRGRLLRWLLRRRGQALFEKIYDRIVEALTADAGGEPLSSASAEPGGEWSRLTTSGRQ